MFTAYEHMFTTYELMFTSHEHRIHSIEKEISARRIFLGQELENLRIIGSIIGNYLEFMSSTLTFAAKIKKNTKNMDDYPANSIN